MLVLASVLVISSCSSKKAEQQTPPAQPAPMVDVIIAQNTSISNSIEVNGTVVANEFVELHPETNGRVVYLQVPEGNYINEGTVIARIYDADLQAQLSKATAQLALAKTTEQRLKKLLDVNGVNQADYDAAVNEITSQQSEVNRLNALITKTVVKAPFSGIVGLRKISIGAYVTSADIITTIQQVNKLKIDFTVPSSYGSLIKKGGQIDVGFDGDKVHHKAIIVATEPQIDAATRNVMVRAMLQSGNPSPGTFAKVYINASAKNVNSIMVPANAIIPDARNKKLVVVKNGNAAFVNVETGVRQAGVVEITSGISEGDSVVVSGVLFARPDKPVKVKAVKQLKDIAN
jgi:membrane fusion protein, multidrug efflux system